MNSLWKKLVIQDVNIAIYVAPSSGRAVHRDRPYHGLVINCDNVERDYIFDDGRVMHTEGGQLFYLPRGSSYEVKTLSDGGCYAINFDAEITDDPFTVTLRSSESVLHDFRTASTEWMKRGEGRLPSAMRALYNAVYTAIREEHREYLSSDKRRLIAPVIDKIDRAFNEDISVSELAKEIGVSEVYMRRIFLNTLGISPKEYIISKRMEYAKSLLSSGDFSVSEVARLVGYSEPCHFSREFSRRVGTNPIKYSSDMTK